METPEVVYCGGVGGGPGGKHLISQSTGVAVVTLKSYLQYSGRGRGVLKEDVDGMRI